MYEHFWGLSRKPFEHSAAGDFFYRSEGHQAALLKLKYVLENRLGAALLAASPGCGKTYVVNQLLHELPDRFAPVARLLFPQLTPPELLAYLAVELGAAESEVGDAHGGLDRTIRQIEKQLRGHCEADRHPVIVVDDAHIIEDRRVFQALQLLLNFQHEPTIEFSLILIGEPCLIPRIQRIGQLDDRIAVKSLIPPLSRQDTTDYIRHRLSAAGAKADICDTSALKEVFIISKGVPRQINRLCDLALLVGYADRLSAVSAEVVEAVSDELAGVVPD